MATNTTKVLIETIVRKALREIQSAPERNIRNLVDMALNFSKGRFQKRFFESAQRMLSNEHTAYYQLVRSITNNVEHERLIRFGMNIGYNSCTLGAKKIREIEAAEGFNIPWALYLEIHADIFAQRRDAYHALICQGKQLGIYTWFIYADSPCTELFELLREHDDCAFVLICNGRALNDDMLSELERLQHILISVELDGDTDMICAEMLRRKLLYAVHRTYTSDDLKDILSDNMLYDTQRLSAPITALIPDAHCPAGERARVYDYVLRKRQMQEFPTILWDMIRDVLLIDTIVSDDCCSAGFHADGTFFSLADGQDAGQWNLFKSDLRTILSDLLQKQ